mmetsp:Transcript_7121/g.12376  ORF Transcript_7121/g.12376 Transcript_7121/m.12376 type:complete len:231 (-) Transcript_7121:373-1065(-)
MLRMINVLLLNRLRVIRGQTREYQQKQRRERQIEAGDHDAEEGGHNEGQQHQHDTTDQAHHQEGAPTGNVTLRGVAIKAQTREGGRGYEERLDDRRTGVDREDVADRHAHHGGEGVEEQLCGGGRRARDDCAESEDHAERREHHDPAEDRGLQRLRVVEQRQQRGVRAKGPSRGESDQQADRHRAVDLVHVGAQALVKLSGGAGHALGAHRLIFSHGVLHINRRPDHRAS